MMKNDVKIILGSAISVFFFLFIALGSGEESRPKPNGNKIYNIEEAKKLGFINASGNGLGTYRNAELIIENLTSMDIKIKLPAGLYLENPDASSQSLLTAIEKDDIQVGGSSTYTISIPTFCMDVSRSIPGRNRNWNLPDNYRGPLDEVIKFYGNFQDQINAWLKKKNPNKFSSQESRLRFFQIVVWCATRGGYPQIVSMIARDVFGNDIEKAKEWLSDVYTDARELADIINRQDRNAFLNWIKNQYSNNKNNLTQSDFSDTGCGVIDENSGTSDYLGNHANFRRIWKGKTQNNEAVFFRKTLDNDWIETDDNQIKYYFSERSLNGTEAEMKDKNRNEVYIHLTPNTCLYYQEGYSNWISLCNGYWVK
jgi:hypothetical protein